MRNEMLGKASEFEDSELSYEWPVREKPQRGVRFAPPDSNRVKKWSLYSLLEFSWYVRQSRV